MMREQWIVCTETPAQASVTEGSMLHVVGSGLANSLVFSAVSTVSIGTSGYSFEMQMKQESIMICYSTAN